jgi:hypothetical protein
MAEPIEYETPRQRHRDHSGCLGCLAAIVALAVAVCHYASAQAVYNYRWSGPDGPNGTPVDLVISFPFDSMDVNHYVFPPRNGHFEVTSLVNALIWGASVASLIWLLAWRRRTTARNKAE